MSKTWVVLLIAGVVVVALFMGTAAAVFLFFPQIQDSITQPKGPVLIYEVDPTCLAPGQAVDVDSLIQAVERRLRLRGRSLARVQAMPHQRIQVILVRNSDEDKRQVEQLLACDGMLEFRILANNRDDNNLIQQALADPAKAKIKDKKGVLLAWWVPVKAGQGSAISGYRDIAMRKRNKAGREITEVLVLNDIYNVTGADLEHVITSQDIQGKPCISFNFNPHGGQLFGQLTGSHLPDKLTGFSYKLAIVLGDEVYSAPSIQSTIYDSGQITGSFTNEEVEAIVELLNTGSLPARIRPVKMQPEN